jgi:hypothetical protein
LTDAEILYNEDKSLNQFVSVKKLAPYRPDSGMVNMKQLGKKKQALKKDAERTQVCNIKTLIIRKLSLKKFEKLRETKKI